MAGRPDLARALVAAAEVIPARVDYASSQPDGRFLGWKDRRPGTAGELWDSVTDVLG